MKHTHLIYDDDPHFEIDPESRDINYVSEGDLILIQGDHNSERFTFELPRYIDGHDMSLCNKVRVHYINIDSDNPDVRAQGVYEVDDIQLCPDDEDNTVVCSWLVSKNATVYVGSLNFVVNFSCVTGSQLDYSWNTGIYSGVVIQKGIDNGEFITVAYTDVLEEWHHKLIEDSLTGVNAILEAKNTALDIIDSAYTNELEEGRQQLIEGRETGVNAINEARNEAIELIGECGGIAVSESEPSAVSVVAWLQDLPEDQVETVELLTREDSTSLVDTFCNSEKIRPLWIIGGLNSADGGANNFTSRMRSALSSNLNTCIDILKDVKVYIFYYDYNCAYISASEEITNGRVYVKDNAPSDAHFFCILAAYKDNRDITDIDAIDALIEVRCAEMTEMNFSFELGAILGASGLDNDNAMRIRTPGMIPISECFITFDTDGGLKYIVFFYDENEKYLGYTDFLTDSHMLTSLAPDNTAFIRIVLAYTDNRVIASYAGDPFYYSLDIMRLANKFHCYTPKDEVYIANIRKSVSTNSNNVDGGSVEVVQTMGDSETAVMSQKTVKDNINLTVDTLCKPEKINFQWQTGGLNSIDGTTNTYTFRMRSILNSNLNVYIDVLDDAKIYVFYFNDKGEYISTSGEIMVGRVYIKENAPSNACFYCIVAGYEDDRDIVDMSDLDVLIEARCVVATEMDFSFESGAILGASGIDTANVTRIRTPNMIPISEYFLAVDADSNVKYSVFFYDENEEYLGFTNFLTDSHMLTSLALDNTAFIRIVLAYNDNSTVAVPDTAPFAYHKDMKIISNKFHCYTPKDEVYIANIRKSVSTNEPNTVSEYVSDVPENIGVLNAILNAKQLVEIVYTPKVEIPHTTNSFSAGVKKTGLPYSSTRPESLFVPNNVSIHTFMTALQNPNSYLYTVDLGEKYNNQNGDTYYGAVCSTLTGYALGIVPNYSTHQWASIPDMEVIENQSAYGLKLCDTIVGNGHVVMVTDITRNKRGKIGHITITEAVNPVCKSTNFTPAELEAAYPPETYKYCRYKKLYTAKHEQSPYVAVEDETPQTVTYNTAIIPRKGDKANWLCGTDVEIDVLQTGSYTKVEIYKDDVLLETRNIASVITLSGLGHGSYKARLTNGTNTSDWCYWMMVDAIASATPVGSDGKVNVTFSATNATPVWVQWAHGSHNGTEHISTLSEQDIENGSTTCAHITGLFKVRVAFKTEYGVIHSALPDAITVV